MASEKNNKDQKSTPIRALIYCRVSTTRQKTEGAGLVSQEHRCRQYAEMKGYAVEAVFPDDASGGGDFMKRPGMCAMLAYLDAQKDGKFVVIFDDLKRFARDTEFHFKLRHAFAERGATVECLNFNFEDTPEGKFIETIVAAHGELEREQNRRQVRQKMVARIEKGYWVFHAPVGYKYITDKVHGKLLSPDGLLAEYVQEALEGYANGRFASQAEVQRFLETKPEFPKDLPNGKIRAWKITKLLRNPLYAGYVHSETWDVSLRKGHHEALIGFGTHEKILYNLENGGRPAARRDFSPDFPLRGFVHCDDCDKPMTAAWSKGCRKHYPYYLCDTPGCRSKRKSIPRAKIEEGFAEILKSMQPTKKLFGVMRTMFERAWDARLDEAKRSKKAVLAQLAGVEDQINKLLDRIVESSSASVISALEKRVEKLEREKFLLTEKAENMVPAKGRFGESIELALKFLSSPWNIYENGSLPLRQTVLRLAFVEPLRYSRENGYRTIETAIPFKVLAGLQGQNCQMVPTARFELATSPLPRECSTPEPCGRAFVLQRGFCHSQTQDASLT
ncbi:hypothetical protein GCM10007972_16700 [Iodidimonas muriae]|uniref:Resolvase/invertase-type recombinase catalytic domain-containing protein n=1 Tax=Iodidimonas muriae TaxID=261467 RepID=A0ABQ2LDC6_9PROT|nr:hypothetical protein GCM10007972_16700 [Iodidimonas muriae]